VLVDAGFGSPEDEEDDPELLDELPVFLPCA
jgi:hypothetical protein